MAVNKVIYGGNTLVDLTGDTVTAADLADGVKATGADGNPIVGLMQKVTIDGSLSDTNTNPVQNKVIKEALDGKLGKNETAAAAIKDGAGNNIVDTYANKTDISGMVKSVNGTAPDDSGNVDLSPMDYAVLIIANTPNYYKRPSLFTVSKTTVTIPKNTQVRVGDKGFQNLADVTLELSTVGDAATRKGKDVYIYACQPSTNTTEPVYVLSLNSTVPTGYTAETSRKIGGFHCLCASVGTISGHTLSGYVAGDILPLSKWDLLHRPVSAPEGMVWLEGISKWVDIYLPSWNGTRFVSAYGGVISDGASSPAFNGERFVEYAGLVGKRPCYRNEFMVFAKGSNEGTNITGSADPNTTGGHVDTAGRRMVSNYGIEDCCGVIWQWGADLFENYPGSAWNSANFYLDGYAWQTKSVYNESFDSQSYGSCSGLLRRVRLGASWDASSNCGSRSDACAYFSANGWSIISSRLVAEPMVVNL